MKRLIKAGAALGLVLTLYACSGQSTSYNKMNNNNMGMNPGTSQSTSKPIYKDGNYNGQGNSNQFGNQIATVIISAGKIRNIILANVDTQGRPVADTKITNSGTTRESSGAGANAAITAQKGALITMMLQKQTYNVNLAQNDSPILDNWKLAVQRALAKASLK